MNDYPQLRSMSMHYIGPSQIEINDFLRRHPDITEIALEYCGVIDIISLNELRKLRKLTIHYVDDVDLRPLAELGMLTAFSFRSSYGDQTLWIFLETSKSSESLEEFELCCRPDNVNRFMNAVTRFTNLKHLSFAFNTELDDSHLEHISRLEKLRVLKIKRLMSITSRVMASSIWCAVCLIWKNFVYKASQ